MNLNMGASDEPISTRRSKEWKVREEAVVCNRRLHPSHGEEDTETDRKRQDTRREAAEHETYLHPVVGEEGGAKEDGQREGEVKQSDRNSSRREQKAH